MALIVSTDPRPSPSACKVAYKEWAGVCRAVGEGHQTILLRKGGIAEQDGLFRPDHEAFWLYPTFSHQAEQGLRWAADGSTARGDDVLLEVLGIVESANWISDLEVALRLSEFHVWAEETVRKRFAYRTPGLWLMGIRAYRLPVPWRLVSSENYEGCKTWVELENAPSTSALVPVLTDGMASERREAVAAAFAGPSLPSPIVPHRPR